MLNSIRVSKTLYEISLQMKLSILQISSSKFSVSSNCKSEKHQENGIVI